MFGKLYSRPVDDQLYAQLLIMTNVTIPGRGKKNLVFAATVNNSVYAYDADLASEKAPYWHVNLTAPGLRPVKNTDETEACGGNYKDFSGNIGIVGTPVIDSSTGTLYVVARSTSTSSSGYVQYLHALDITTGAEKPNSPKLITASVAGTGSGSVRGIITFDAQKQNQRSGLLLLDGKIFICYASHCDWGPYHGWILAYDKTTLKQTNVYNNTPDGYNGGIWMSGGAPSADNAGNIYIASGNGSVGIKDNPSDLRNRSESAVKLMVKDTGFTTLTFFTPSNYTTLEGSDLDFGVTQVLLIPNTNRVMVSCKDGTIYLLDKDNMGGFNAGQNKVIQSISFSSNAHLHASLSYYKGSQKEFVYAWSENTALKAFPYDRNLNSFDLAKTVNSGSPGPVGNSGAFTSISSNGSVDSTAVLWASFAVNGDANQSVRPGILRAFDASDVTKELWNSLQDPADSSGNYAKFNCPTIANGKVYLATFSNQFIVYGLTGGTATDCNSPDIALNRPAVASSDENTTNNAAAAFDGNPATRWASKQGVDPQNIYVDLGAKYNLCHVVLQWEIALGKNFTIDVSDNATTWTTIKTITNNTNFTNYISLKGSGRYIRMNGTARGSKYGYSLYSFEVYGTPVISDCPVPDLLAATNISETSATLHWKANVSQTFILQYKEVTATNWMDTTIKANTIVLNNLNCGGDYFFRVQSTCSSSSSAYSTSASFSTLHCSSNCSPLPTRWTTQDIGNTALAGSACYASNVFTLKGSGDDIGGTTDAFRFATQSLVGDGEFVARVASLDASNTLSKCGIMIRETQSPGSKYAFIALTGGKGAIFQTRSATDGSSKYNNSSSGDIVAPFWIKLVKAGSVYTAYFSKLGNDWVALGTPVNAGFGSGEPVYAGLAITSHDNAKLSTATIDNYSYTNGLNPMSLLSFNAALNFSHTVDINWSTTLETNSSYFVIERSHGNSSFIAIDTVKAVNNGSFTTFYHAKDKSPLDGINLYRLKMVDIEGHFSYSTLVLVRVTDSKAPMVFPNPARTIINIAGGTDSLRYITIYDISGKMLIREKTAGSAITQLSTSGLPRGIYIIEITTASNEYRDKLIIQ